MSNQIQRINPEGLFKSPAFSQAVTTTGQGKTIYIGGQNAVNAKGEAVGKGDLGKQTVQVMENIKIALEATGGTFEHVVKLTIYIVKGQDVRLAFQSSQPYMKDVPKPAITGVTVEALGNPDYLLEIDAVAFIPA